MTGLLAALAVSPELIRLANGIPLIVDFREDSSLVTLVALARCDDQPADRLAALEVACRAVMRETQTFSTQRLRYLSWLVGGRVEVELANDTVRFEVTTAPSHFSLAATLLSEVTQRVSFGYASLEKASADVARDQDSRATMPWYPGVREFRGELGIGPRGPVGLTPAVASALWQEVVRPERMSLAVVGAMPTEAVVSRLSASFGLWEPVPAPGFRVPRGRHQAEQARPHASIMAAVRGPNVESDRFAAWLVYCTSIGWGAGSVLHSTIRNQQGWAYQTGCALTLRKTESHAIFYFTYLKGPDPAERRDELNRLLRAATETLDQASVNRAKALLAGQYEVSLGGPEGIVPFGQGHVAEWDSAFWLAWWELRGGHSRDTKFVEEIRAVTLEQVQFEAESAARTLRLKVG